MIHRTNYSSMDYWYPKIEKIIGINLPETKKVLTKNESEWMSALDGVNIFTKEDMKKIEDAHKFVSGDKCGHQPPPYYIKPLEEREE